MHTDLWNFALNLYARPGVEVACLQWQDHGGDVCLLLCVAWLGERGVTPDESRLQALRSLADVWQDEVVKPLRSLRRQWRTAALQDLPLASLRDQVKGLELAAERMLLERLQALSEGWATNAEEGTDWLPLLTSPDTRLHHDARHVLRAAMQMTQDADDGV